jgi:hypothetical protein
MAALREKVPYEQVSETGIESVSEDGAERRGEANERPSDTTESTHNVSEPTNGTAETPDTDQEAELDRSSSAGEVVAEAEAEQTEVSAQPDTLRGHTRSIIGEETGRVRLLDDEFGTLAEDDAAVAFDLVADSETVPTAIVLDDELQQRLLDIAAQRGIDHIVAASMGEFVKRPTSVRIRTADQLLAQHEA